MPEFIRCSCGRLIPYNPMSNSILGDDPTICDHCKGKLREKYQEQLEQDIFEKKLRESRSRGWVND